MAVELSAEVVGRLTTATRVVVLTGAGISVESGVSTFREAQSTESWAQFDPTELATPQAFLRNPRLVWEWYEYRRQKIEETLPSAAHYALVDFEQYYTEFLLVTQNIDGLHWRAGSRELLELHGNIGRMRCFECGNRPSSWDDSGEKPPRCSLCGGMLRPDVVWLGEGISERRLRMAYDAAEHAEVFLSIGTSASVQPAASLPLIAKRRGAYVIEINPEETALSVLADSWLQGAITDILSDISHRLIRNHEAES
jgi:NAD-dependent deacetylase